MLLLVFLRELSELLGLFVVVELPAPPGELIDWLVGGGARELLFAEVLAPGSVCSMISCGLWVVVWAGTVVVAI
jgi:hypothetical protein